MKLTTLTEDFLFHCEVERGLSAHTVDSYRHDLNQFTQYVGDKSKAKPALKPEKLKSFLTDMSRRRGLAVSTLRRRLACLKALTRFANERYAMPDPFETWQPKIKQPNRLPQTLPRSEVSQLLSPASKDADGEITFALLVLGSTGLRISELCSMKVADVSPTGDVIRVKGKGAKDRVVFLTHERIQQYMRRRRHERYRLGGNDASILINSRGDALRPQTLRRRLHDYANRLGIESRVTPHRMRHTAATMLIEEGADIRFVQKLLGHASISTTELYTHVTNDALRSAVTQANTMGAVLGDQG